jgi:hypothetical protein
MRVTDTESFINKAKCIHGDKYDYSSSVYVDARTKIKIKCPIHGEFLQSPCDHNKGNGCIDCGFESTKNSRLISIEDARKRLSLIQPNIKILNRIIGRSNKVLVEDDIGIKYIVGLCKLFEGKIPAVRSALDPQNAFILKSSNVHSGIYSYEKLIYVDSNSSVIITCHKHGDFKQVAKKHLFGQGCPACARDRITTASKNNPTGWTISDWIKAGESSKSFIGYRVYILECFNKTERFVKIGRTFNPIQLRYKCESRMPYEYNIIAEIEGSAHHMFKLESKLKRMCKNFKYSVGIPFGGQYECFTPDCLELLKDYINKE